MRKRLALIIALPLIIVCSAALVTMMAAQESPVGATSARIAENGSGAPKGTSGPRTLEAEYYPDRIYRGNPSLLYRVSRTMGVLASTDNGENWTLRNTGLPRRAVYPFSGDMPPIITSFGVDAKNARRVALTLPDSLYVSEDGGTSWTNVSVKEPLKPNDQLTAVALDSADPNTILLGTSFHGFFETRNRGKTWSQASEKLGFLYLGGGSYEEVASLAYLPMDPTRLVFCLGYGKGLYVVQRGTNAAVKMDFPGNQDAAPIRDVWFAGPDAAGAWKLEARTAEARWSLPFMPSTGNGTLSYTIGAWELESLIDVTVQADPAKEARAAKAAGKYGIYLSSYNAKGETLDRHIAFCKANGINSIVVDFKDDFGMVTYDTALETPRKIGAVDKRFDAAKLAKKAHENGLYLIGRIVVFRDKSLYNANGHAYALWDRVSNAPWGYVQTKTDPDTGEETTYQGEHWVDQYSPAVWRYNVDIACEAAAFGVDEIQFDYIRFPSDGDLSRISYRFKKPAMGKVEALASFLAMARENLSIPIGTDVYGYCGWARVSGWVAQNIEEFSRYVDVISPMYYPSHFPQDFLGTMSYIPRAGYIYKEGGYRAVRIVEGRCVIRPYVQAFRLGGELKFSPATYTQYLLAQIQGSLESGASGFTLWNASNDYYMVTFPLAAYLPAQPVEVSGPGAPSSESRQGG